MDLLGTSLLLLISGGQSIISVDVDSMRQHCGVIGVPQKDMFKSQPPSMRM